MGIIGKQAVRSIANYHDPAGPKTLPAEPELLESFAQRHVLQSGVEEQYIRATGMIELHHPRHILGLNQYKPRV